MARVHPPMLIVLMTLMNPGRRFPSLVVLCKWRGAKDRQ